MFVPDHLKVICHFQQFASRPPKGSVMSQTVEAVLIVWADG
jgi:hypothetical protein